MGLFKTIGKARRAGKRARKRVRALKGKRLGLTMNSRKMTKTTRPRQKNKPLRLSEKDIARLGSKAKAQVGGLFGGGSSSGTRKRGSSRKRSSKSRRKSTRTGGLGFFGGATRAPKKRRGQKSSRLWGSSSRATGKRKSGGSSAPLWAYQGATPRWRNPVIRTSAKACPNCHARTVLMDGKKTVCAKCGVTRNPGKTHAVPAGSQWQKWFEKLKKSLKGPTEKKATNPCKNRRTRNSAKEVFEEFRGKPVRSSKLYKAAEGTPKDVGVLGGLQEFKLRGGHFLRFDQSKVKLAADGRKKLHILGARMKVRGATPGDEHDAGEVMHVVYVADKPHIDGGVVTEYVHKFGEEGGVLPHLVIDREGYPKLEGGSYRITEDGIID